MRRPLRTDELELVRTMLRGKPVPDLIANMGDSLVEDLEEGGMGSIRFVKSGRRVLGAAIAEAEYTDDAGVLVSIAVNSDDRGELYGLTSGRSTSYRCASTQIQLTSE